MGLVLDPVAATASTAVANKMIFTDGTTTESVLYTVPAGRKFIGHANLHNSGSSYFKAGSLSMPNGTTRSVNHPIFLQAGKSITGNRCNITGIESDA
tara:strand:- start:386 stop:676 length:291 start_codon:yes stop_codon:yes gene_type:complete